MSAAAASTAGGGGGGQQNLQPFLLNSQEYTEAPFGSFSSALGASSVDVTPVFQVTPGNFLDGIDLFVSSTGGVLGTTATVTGGALAAISSISFVNTNGGPILYPMGLRQYVLAQKYLRPWRGDPQKDASYSNTVNPVVTVELSIAVKDTLGILSNTDARAQYRLNVTLAPLTNVVSATTGVTAPTVTVKVAVRERAQPPAVDYMGRPINPFPPGLGVSRKLMTQTLTMAASGTSTLQLTLTGDEIRGFIFMFFNSSGALTDLTDANAGTILFRQDNGVQWWMTPTQWVNRMERFYAQYFGRGQLGRETGVYAIPRFRSPNGGDPWLATVEQTYLNIQIGSGDVASGTVQVIYDNIAVGIPLDPSMESI